ncbi:MAG: putative baseplate assembly protein [Caldilineaceae bacterium]
MQAPKIDQRTNQDIVAETEALAQTIAGWQPRADGAPDAGQALIRIFGRFADLVVQRLNRVPEKNFLAFLNLIGAEPLPPQPARVPLTFLPVDNAPVDPVVPMGAQVAAPPRAGEEEAIVFETEQELIVTRAQITAAYVYDPRTDRYTDCLPQVRGELDAPFAVFMGTQAVIHELYVACDPLLLEAAGRTVHLNVYSPSRWQWEEWPCEWAYWREDGWQPLSVNAQYIGAENCWQVTVNALPELTPNVVNGVEAAWIRVRLNLPLPPAQQGLTPTAIGIGSSNNPIDFSTPFQPFGESYTYWYLDGAEFFAHGGAIAHLDFTLSPGTGIASPDLRLLWEYKSGASTWQRLGESNPANASVGESSANLQDETRAFTQSGQVRFRIPLGWELQDQRSRRGRWLRVKIDAGGYTTMPTLANLTLGWHWNLPRVRQITATLAALGAGAGDSPVGHYVPELGFANTTPLDLGRDFLPFGSQPAYNDTLYVACDGALAQPGATIEVTITLTNPANSNNAPVKVVSLAGKPVVIWELFTGQTWQTLLQSPADTASPLSLTANGALTLNLPANLQSVLVNGEERYWLRARLVGGNFGVAASYTGNAQTGYTLVEATYAPPLVKAMTFAVTKHGVAAPKAGAARVLPATLPVAACMTNNGGAFMDVDAIAAADDDGMFLPFTALDVREPALYLGLDQPFAPRPFTLYAQVEPPRPEAVAAEMLQAPTAHEAARVVWEYTGADGWNTLGALDETAMLSRRGLIHFIGPRDFSAQPFGGQTLHWIRARWQRGTFAFPPQLRRVLLNTTWATQAATSHNEILGSSNGDPAQRFTTVQTPVLPGEQLDVRERELPVAAEVAAIGGADALTVTFDTSGEPDEIWVRWQAVTDLYASGPRDRHYIIDRLTGEIRFGNGRQGLVPPLGPNNIRLTHYRSGGGLRGNCAADTIVELKSSLPYIDSAINYEPSTGGAEQEALARVKARGSAALRHRNRAVTAQDLADLAYAATPDIARVAAIVPVFDPYLLWVNPGPNAASTDHHAEVHAGECGLVIVPHGSEARPTPGLQLIERVRAHVLAHSSATMELWVAGPEWVAVNVSASVAPTSLALADVVVANIQTALNRYLHPLTGGPQGQGWPFGTVPHRSDLYHVLEAVAGVDHVRTLALTLTPMTAHGDQDALRAWLQRTQTQATALTEEERGWQNWVNRSLVFAGAQTIRVVLDNQLS